MNWLARLKKNECVPDSHPTKPTEPGFVGFVAPIPEPFQKSAGDPGAANEADSDRPDCQGSVKVSSMVSTETEVSGAVSARQPDREAWPERAAIAEFDGGLSRQDAEALADASCWPHSTAMNGAEIDTFTARLARFTDRGLSLIDAERLADRLVQRDRDLDDRRLCLECAHLRHGGRCGNWQHAGVAIRARDNQLHGDFTAMLQRCDGFTAQR